MPKFSGGRRSALSVALFEAGITQAELGAMLNPPRTPAYVSIRMSGKKSWEVWEAYTILKVLNRGTDEMTKLFPKPKGEKGHDRM